VRKISATLPALGSYTIPFYKESARILEFLGEKELNRLSKISHLGTTSAVFTGINHSRLEYMFLQCAIINLLPKFNLETEQFAISGKVKLSGGNHEFSSGEELLKCWSILSSIGHSQYTYGVERSLLSYLRRNASSQAFFLSMIEHKEMRNWSKEVINNYQDANFHWVLSSLKLSQCLVTTDPDKSLFDRCLMNLLMPLENLKFRSHKLDYLV
jgi:HD superfamily phosphohydrolase